MKFLKLNLYRACLESRYFVKNCRLFRKALLILSLHISKYEGVRESVFFEKRWCFLPVWTFSIGPYSYFKLK